MATTEATPMMMPSMVRATVTTGKMVRPMMLVVSEDQQYTGMRNQLMPGARIFTIVAIMLMALNVVPSEESWKAHIQ